MMLIGSKSGKKKKKANLGKMEAKHKFWKKIQGTVSVQEMLCFPVSTSFGILTITCSFLIRFE